MEIPVEHKLLLTIDEASKYSNIGTKRLYEMTSDPLCPFLIMVGTKKLIKREKFEKYLISQNEV